MTRGGVFLRRRGDPRRWPAAGAAALAGLGLLLLVPRAWLTWLDAPAARSTLRAPADPGRWLVLVPPSRVEIVPDRPEPARRAPPAPPPPVDDPADWWRRGWRVRVAAAADVRRPAPPAPTPADSARLLLRSLGVAGDPAATVGLDSVLAARLVLLAREESWRLDELKPYLAAMGRAADYADLRSRVADMYDDFLATEIMVPR